MPEPSSLVRTKNYFVQLDGLRFLAVSSVMFGHWVKIPLFNIINRYRRLGIP